MREEKENWRDIPTMKYKRAASGPTRRWTGYTEFQLRKLPPEAELALMVKRGSDEKKTFVQKNGSNGALLTELSGAKWKPPEQ